MNSKWICVVAGVLLLAGIPTGWPYSFYILLRWVVTISAAIVAYNSYKQEKSFWIWVFGGVAILFNPIAPIYLNKGIWVLIDLVCAVLFFVSASNHTNKK
jgi:hypothetical protein